MTFAHPWWAPYGLLGPEPLTKKEWDIFEISKLIRTKPNWQLKYKDKTIVSKWNQELKSQFEYDEEDFNQMFDFTIRELQWYETLTEEFLNSQYVIECDDKIVSSDKVIEEDVRSLLVNQTNDFIEQLDELDYHPGSNNQVLDLVHPSLFPLQYGVTPIKVDNKYQVAKFDKSISEVKKGVESWGISEKYQWLPSLLTKNDNQFKISSYINNLHPIRFKSLYDTIETVFNSIVPGLNFTLSRFQSAPLLRIPYDRYDDAYNEEWKKLTKNLNDMVEEDRAKNGEIDWDKFDPLYEEVYDTDKTPYLKKLVPEYKEDPVTEKYDLLDFDNIKVIVKLASIELTPENPTYKGGSWHVEGTINEDIVATILYYYDIENITESKLSFRASYEDPPYEQGDSLYCEKYFGLEDENKMVYNLGSVEAKQNRVLIFPNCFQHHVDPFELSDKSKPGHRKILCFFLIDPSNDKVVTTADVPPQQETWWNDNTLTHLIPKSEINSSIRQFTNPNPGIIQSILDKIGPESAVDWPITLSDAKVIREKLMEERSMLQKDDDDERNPFERSFSLCEH